MRLEQLNHVVEIAKYRSISRAAEALYISQPALSASIKNLESELGKILFKRTNKGIVLTADGEQICRQAADIQNVIDGWHETQGKRDPEGEVHIAGIPLVNSYITLNMIVPFQDLHPGITVYLHNVRHYDIIERLKTTNASIALTTLSLYSRLMEQVGMLDWENCKLANDERKLFLGAEHPLAKKEHLTLGDLKTLRLAWISDSRDRISREYARYFDSSYRLGNKEDCLSLAIRNEAVFIQAHRLFSSDWRMRQHLLVARSIPIAELDSHTEIYAFHAPELSEAEQVFWDYLIQEFPRHLHQDNAV